MAGRVNIIQLSGRSPDAGAVVTTAAEAALLNPTRTTLRAFFDAKTATVDDAGMVQSLRSRKRSAGLEQTLLPTTSASAPRLGNSTDGQKAIFMGLPGLGGAVIGGDANGALIGSAPLVLPNTNMVVDDFMIGWCGAHAADANGTIWSTNDPVNPIKFNMSTNGRINFFSKGSLTDPVSFAGDAGNNNGALHWWRVSYQKSTGIVRIYRDGVEIKNGVLSFAHTYTNLSLRFGAGISLTTGAPADRMEGYMESTMLFSGLAATDVTAAKSIIAERHPGLTLA